MLCQRECADNCGVAAVGQTMGAEETLGKCLFHLQHRGQRSVGLGALLQNKKNVIEVAAEVAPGLVKPNRHLFRHQENSLGLAIGHVSLKEPQPFLAYTKMGTICLAFSGNIINAPDIKQQALRAGQPFSTNDQAEVLVWLICQADDPVSGLLRMAERIHGSYTLVMLTEDGIYAARDPHGFKPFVIGRGTAGGNVIVSESPAITEIGMEIVGDVKPGEILFLKRSGITVVGRIPNGRVTHCAFEWAYTARYDAKIDGVSVKNARNNMGASLAKGDNVHADLVAPIPMSGIGHAQGYHKYSGVRYDDVFFYNRYSDRSYTPLTQEQRDNVAAEKLSLIRDAIAGQEIVLCDDSIVRGTQMGKQIKRLRDAGAKKIHLRVASPPLIAPCRYGISTRSYDELIARQHTLEEIRKKLGADTLKYNGLDDFVAAIGLPKERLCLACFTGEYPV